MAALERIPERLFLAESHHQQKHVSWFLPVVKHMSSDTDEKHVSFAAIGKVLRHEKHCRKVLICENLSMLDFHYMKNTYCPKLNESLRSPMSAGQPPAA